jgi:dihydroorotase
VAAGPDVSGDAAMSLEYSDCLLLPGLVDMHAHPAPPDWKYGVDADGLILLRGSTTILSQGDAGAANWPLYRDSIIGGSRTRILMALSPAIHGEQRHMPTYENLEEVDVDACVDTIKNAGDSIWGIAVNVAAPTCAANDPRVILKRVLQMAERTGKPLLYGIRWDPFDWALEEQLELLRPGDVVTYCLHAGPGGIAPKGRVVDAAWKARERGVLFDVGHGMSSFDFGVAEAAVADGFLPDTISTDFYRRHVGSQPRHDLPRTLSKLIAAGMSETDALERATARPAKTLGLLGEVGTLASGACADLAVLRWEPEAAPLRDVAGAERPGGCWEPVLTVRAGKVVLTPA